MNPNPEAQKRLKLLENLVDTSEVYRYSSAIFLAGSVAYGPERAVTSQSDIDIVIVAKRFLPVLQSVLGYLHQEKMYETFKNVLKHRFFDGVTAKLEHDKVPISLHVLTDDALDVIAKCFVADVRLLREGGKSGNYQLTGFEGQTYDYTITNIPLPEAQGFYRTIVPVTFINKDRYYLAIHRDKLLSNPRFIHDPTHVALNAADKVWSIVAKNLADESHRLMGKIDLNKMSVTNAMIKFPRMDPQIQDKIRKAEQYHISRYAFDNSL